MRHKSMILYSVKGMKPNRDKEMWEESSKTDQTKEKSIEELKYVDKKVIELAKRARFPLSMQATKLRAIEKMWFPSFNRVECLDGQITTTRGLGYEGRGYLSDEDCEYKWNEKLIALCGALAATCFMTNDSDSDDTNSGWDSYEPPTPEPDENDHEPIEDTLRSERSPIPSPRSPTPSLTWGVSSRFRRNENRPPRPKRDDLPSYDPHHDFFTRLCKSQSYEIIRLRRQVREQNCTIFGQGLTIRKQQEDLHRQA